MTRKVSGEKQSEKMRFGMPARNKTLRSASELVEAQVIKPERLAGLQKIAARYAVAIRCYCRRAV